MEEESVRQIIERDFIRGKCIYDSSNEEILILRAGSSLIDALVLYANREEISRKTDCGIAELLTRHHDMTATYAIVGLTWAENNPLNTFSIKELENVFLSYKDKVRLALKFATEPLQTDLVKVSLIMGFNQK